MPRYTSALNISSVQADIETGVATFTPPPSGPHASIGWVNPTDPSFDHTRVFRATSPSFLAAADVSGAIGSPTTTFIDLGAAPSTEYWYWVIAYDAAEDFCGQSNSAWLLFEDFASIAGGYPPDDIAVALPSFFQRDFSANPNVGVFITGQNLTVVATANNSPFIMPGPFGAGDHLDIVSAPAGAQIYPSDVMNTQLNVLPFTDCLPTPPNFLQSYGADIPTLGPFPRIAHFVMIPADIVTGGGVTGTYRFDICFHALTNTPSAAPGAILLPPGTPAFRPENLPLPLPQPTPLPCGPCCGAWAPVADGPLGVATTIRGVSG